MEYIYRKAVENMSSFMLKLLAMTTMVVDHTGAILFPGNMALRVIGRLSFPIYCFLLAEGFVHTSSRKRYLIRLGLWGIVSEPVFDYAFFGRFWVWEHQNVFFTLFLGLSALCLIEGFSSGQQKFMPGLVLALVPAAAAEMLMTDYGAFGVLLIVVFYVCRDRRGAGLVSFGLFNTAFSCMGSEVQFAAVAAAVPIGLYNGKRGLRLPGWLFYAFYPVHLGVLCLLAMAL